MKILDLRLFYGEVVVRSYKGLEEFFGFVTVEIALGFIVQGNTWVWLKEICYLTHKITMAEDLMQKIIVLQNLCIWRLG